MEAYRHTVQYYETDMMGIVHHSNHVKWMEEARVDFLKNIGWEYRKLEELGVFSPVLEISCKYKNPARFGDEINVDVAVTDFNGITMGISYIMRNSEGKTVCEAKSSHCFVGAGGRPVNLKRVLPDFHAVMAGLLPEK